MRRFFINVFARYTRFGVKLDKHEKRYALFDFAGP